MSRIPRVAAPPKGFAALAKRRLSFPQHNVGAVDVLAKVEDFITEQMQADIGAAISAGLSPPGDPAVPFVYTADPAFQAATDTGASIDVTVWYKPL